MMQKIQLGLFLTAALAIVWVSAVPTARVVKKDAASCACQDAYACGCCVSLSIPALNISETACANETFDITKKEFELSLSLNGEVVFERDISVANLPPVCAGFRSLVQVCSRLIDLDFEETQISGCLELDVWVRGELRENVTLGCLTIPVPPSSHSLTFQPQSPYLLLPAKRVGAAKTQALPVDWDSHARLAASRSGQDPLFQQLSGLLSSFGDALHNAAASQAKSTQQ